MAEDICAPYVLCDGLDSRLLINRTADGPAIGIELADMPFGPVTMKGASLHPYVRWTYSQTWSAKEACLGPARSVLGLAPGETLTLEVVHRRSVDTMKLVREAASRSNILSRSERRPTHPQSQAIGNPLKLDLHDAETKKADYAKIREERLERQRLKEVELHPLHYADLGSPFLELIVGAFVGAAAGVGVSAAVSSVDSKQADAKAALGGAGKQTWHEEKVRGPGSINHDTSQRVGEILEEVERAENESTTTRESTEERIVRTFTNPYRDRTLELRFFPVFRRFEVSTSPLKAQPGVLLRPGTIDFSVGNPRAKLAAFVEAELDATALATTAFADPGEEREGAAALRTSAIADHLAANSALYTRRYLDHIDRVGGQDALLALFARMIVSEPANAAGRSAKDGPSLAQGLAWSRVQVKNGEIHVPFAEPANWPESWQQAGGELAEGIKATIGNATWRNVWTTTRSVHLFMGTHVEAVAGSCVLKDVPPVTEAGGDERSAERGFRAP